MSIKECSEEFIVGTRVVCRNVKRRPSEDAADPVFSNSIRGTPRRLLPDDEPREPRESREQSLRLDVSPVHTDLPFPINAEPTMPRRVHIRISVELVRYGCTPGCIGCEAAMTQVFFRMTTRNSEGHESSKPCLQMPTSVHESWKCVKECRVQCLMRNRT